MTDTCCRASEVPVFERDSEWRHKCWSLSLGHGRSLAGSGLPIKELCRNPQADRANDRATKLSVGVQRPLGGNMPHILEEQQGDLGCRSTQCE